MIDSWATDGFACLLCVSTLERNPKAKIPGFITSSFEQLEAEAACDVYLF